jgi:hypothetical protein
MNAKNRMCRLSAAKNSKWAREPPCEWLASTPALVTEASQEQTTRRENWGEYYNDPDSWPHGFNTDSGKSTEITGEGSVVGLCVDVRSRPWFYAVFMRSIEVFYFSVTDVTECDTAAAHKTPVAPVQLPAQQQAQPILYSNSAQAAAPKTPSSAKTPSALGQLPAQQQARPILYSANANVEDLYEHEEELRKAEEEALEADTGDVESEGDNTHEAKKQADPVHVAGGGKQKHTHWIHNTRIACLRLIRSRNPFASRDSGLTWQQIAEEMHKDTEGITEQTERGKVKDCQVHSNGQSLMMWYRRQMEGMEKAFSDKSERSTSGQGGLRQKAISVAAQKAAESEENIQKEWDVLASLKALHEDAVKEAKCRKEATAKVKDLKDNKFPDAIEEMACESSEVMLATMKELHRRKRLYEQRAATLQGASRMPIMTDQEKKDFELLERLKKHRRDTGGEEVVDEGDTTTDGHLTSPKADGRGKASMYKESFQNMSAALGKLTASLDEDGKRDERVTAVQLKRAFAELEADIVGGLELEAGERQFIREQYLRRFARLH